MFFIKIFPCYNCNSDEKRFVSFIAVCVFSNIRTNPRGNHTLIVVGVNTHVIVLQIERILTELDVLEFILVEVRPSPQTSVYDMRETLPPSHLRSNDNTSCQQYSIITGLNSHSHTYDFFNFKCDINSNNHTFCILLKSFYRDLLVNFKLHRIVL